MAETESERGHSGDLPRYLQPPPRTCWFCRAPEPRGWDTLGGGVNGQGGTKIPVCATGEGCRDGKVRHGPQGDPHWPDEDCPICGPGSRQRAVQRNTGRATAVPRPVRSNSPKRRPPR